MTLRRCLLLLVVLLTPLQAPAADSLGTDFWVGFPQNYDGSADIRLQVTSSTAAEVTATVAASGFSVTQSVSPGVVTIVILPTMPPFMLDPGHGVNNYAVHVTATAEVSVVGTSEVGFGTSGAFTAIPSDGLGQEYVLDNVFSPYFQGLDGEFMVVATQDNTLVDITYPAGQGCAPLSVTINRGELYSGAGCTGQDMAGTFVNASKPVAVYVGHECAVGAGAPPFFCDQVAEALPPVRALGKTFPVVPVVGRTAGDQLRVVASEDGTQLSVDSSFVTALQRGQSYDLFADQPTLVETSKPALVLQITRGLSESNLFQDPLMTVVPPVEKFGAGALVATPDADTAFYDEHYARVVVPTAAAASLLVNGVGAATTAFPSAPAWSHATVPVPMGVVSVMASAPAGTIVYGFSEVESYAYAAGMIFDPNGKRATTLQARDIVSLRLLGGLLLSVGTPQATLRDQQTAAPLAMQPVRFTAGGTPLCTGVTNAGGVAQCATPLALLPFLLLGGGYAADFDGNATHDASQDGAALLSLP